MFHYYIKIKVNKIIKLVQLFNQNINFQNFDQKVYKTQKRFYSNE